VFVQTAPEKKKQSATSSSRDEHSPKSNLATWHTLSIDQAFGRLQADAAQGLTPAEAARRLAQYGANALSPARQRSTLSIFIAQFRSLIVALLVAATAIAYAMGDQIEAVAILVVFVINAAIGFLTEWKADRTLSALQKQSVPIAACSLLPVAVIECVKLLQRFATRDPSAVLGTTI
jgi:magnesium-transporting ATPase (P-type)